MKLLTDPQILFKNRARDTTMQGIYILNVCKIFGFSVQHFHLCTNGGEIWCRGVDHHAIFCPRRYNVLPLQGENLKITP